MASLTIEKKGFGKSQYDNLANRIRSAVLAAGLIITVSYNQHNDQININGEIDQKTHGVIMSTILSDNIGIKEKEIKFKGYKVN